MTARDREPLAVCTYCRMPIAPRGLERDHFPIPQDSGGKTTVTVCRNCHSLKDRVALDRLPDAAAIIRRLAGGYGAAGPSPLALIAQWDGVPGLSTAEAAIPSHWDAMPPVDRVVWSRLLALRIRSGADLWAVAVQDAPDAAAMLATVVQMERGIISTSTRAALADRKRQGMQLGQPTKLPTAVLERITRELADGRSLRAVARGLETDGIPTATGRANWSAQQVRTAAGSQRARAIIATTQTDQTEGTDRMTDHRTASGPTAPADAAAQGVTA